jgi:hypothetical protein
MAGVIDQFFKVNGVARDADNNKLNNEKNTTISVKRKTDLKLFCYNHHGCVCSVIYRRFIQDKTHFVKHQNDLSDYVIHCSQY